MSLPIAGGSAPGDLKVPLQSKLFYNSESRICRKRNTDWSFLFCVFGKVILENILSCDACLYVCIKEIGYDFCFLLQKNCCPCCLNMWYHIWFIYWHMIQISQNLRMLISFVMSKSKCWMILELFSVLRKNC